VTSLRKNYFIYGLIFSFAAALLFSWLISGENGFLNLCTMQKEMGRCLAVVMDLKEKNELLSDEIRRLRGDPKHLESVVRKELGLVRDNEIIYRFQGNRGEEGK